MKPAWILVMLVVLAGGCVQTDKNIQKETAQQPASPAAAQTTVPTTIPTPTPSPTPLAVAKIQPYPCTGAGAVNFTSPPRLLADIEMIQPIGLINANSGHVTPTDHGYYYPPGWEPQDDPVKFRDVLAPADGIITTLQLVGNRQGDYRMVIHHTCTFYTIYIHIKELSPRIAQAAGAFTQMTKNTNIPVSAGEVIGRANSFDFSVHDDEMTLKGFVVPEHYNGEPWKIHTTDMFAYFAEPVRSQLLAKNTREAEPRAGRIDYDIDGRIVGNWFVENTGGYSPAFGDYWRTHLSFAYDGIDPSLVVISIGDFAGKSAQFAVKGNAPNPAEVSTGMVKYELIDIDYVSSDGQYWDRRSYAKGLKAVSTGEVRGVALVQMTDGRKIKFEAFPGKSAADVAGFTAAAKIYER